MGSKYRIVYYGGNDMAAVRKLTEDEVRDGYTDSSSFHKPAEFNIDNLFKGKYNIPIYQRPYSWETNRLSSFYRILRNHISYTKNIQKDNPLLRMRRCCYSSEHCF